MTPWLLLPALFLLILAVVLLVLWKSGRDLRGLEEMTGKGYDHVDADERMRPFRRVK